MTEKEAATNNDREIPPDIAGIIKEMEWAYDRGYSPCMILDPREIRRYVEWIMSLGDK